MSNKDLTLLGIVLFMLAAGPALFLAFGRVYLEYGEGTFIDPGQGKTRSQKAGVEEGGTFYEWVERAEEIQMEKAGASRDTILRGAAKPVTTEPESERVRGAYYPGDHQEPEGYSVDPLLIAVMGGSVVFGGVGAGLFLLLRPKEPEVLEEPEGEEALEQLVETVERLDGTPPPPPISPELIAHQSLAVTGDQLHEREGQ